MTSDGTFTFTFSYSSENLLTGASGTPVSPLTIGYDPLTRLYSTNAAGGMRLQYDGQAMASVYNTSGTLQRRFVFGPGADEPLVWYEGTGTAARPATPFPPPAARHCSGSARCRRFRRAGRRR